MIYLIGGPPRCGKSTLAELLSKKLKISWISADTLESIVQVYTPTGIYAKRFPKNIIRRRTGNSNDIMYEKYLAKDIMQAYIQQAKACWRAVEVLIESEIKNDNNFIIEGAQLHPKLISRLQVKFGKENIAAVFLIRTTHQLIVEGAKKNKAKNDWFLQKTHNETTHLKVAKMIALYGKWYQHRADEKNLLVINTEKNFKTQIQAAARALLK